MSPLAALIAADGRTRRPAWFAAFACAGLAAIASVVLLGLSGWFLTAAALAGGAGPTVALAFNYMLPSAGIRLLAIVRTGARYGERLAGHAAALGTMAGVRAALFRSVAGRPAHRALTVGRGAALARLVEDVALTENALVRRPASIAAGAALVAATAMILLAGWLPVAILAVVAASVLLLAGRFAGRADACADRVAQAGEAMREALSILIDAAPELRCYGLEEWAAARADAPGRALLDAQLAHHRALARIDLMMATAIATAAAACLVAALPAGPAIAAMTALAGAMGIDSLTPLVRRRIERGAARAAARRLDAMLAADAAEPLEPIALEAARVRIAPFLSEASQRGRLTVIRAPSGAGKTSAIERLIGLRPLPPGIAQIDGIDAAWLAPRQRRAIFAHAPQDAQLLSGTLRENLLLAAPQASDAELHRALDDARLGDVVAALPRGIDSWIGENGERLSGGERRRVALARAMLSPAPWMLLDEPTAGLDAPLAREVLARLARRIARDRRGAILVTHEPLAMPLISAERAAR